MEDVASPRQRVAPECDAALATGTRAAQVVHHAPALAPGLANIEETGCKVGPAQQRQAGALIRRSRIGIGYEYHWLVVLITNCLHAVTQQMTLVHCDAISEMRALDLPNQHSTTGDGALGVLAGGWADQAGAGDRAVAVRTRRRADQNRAVDGVGLIEHREQLATPTRAAHVVVLLQICRRSFACRAISANNREPGGLAIWGCGCLGCDLHRLYSFRYLMRFAGSCQRNANRVGHAAARNTRCRAHSLGSPRPPAPSPQGACPGLVECGACG